jgi:hypothetical protein
LYPRGSCVGHDSRNKTAFPDVAFLDIEAEAWVLAADGETARRGDRTGRRRPPS